MRLPYPKYRPGLAALLFLLLHCAAASAQTTTAALSGTVRDEAGALLPGVHVTARDLQTGLARAGDTDEGGRYRILQLAPGVYEVSAEAQGFQTTLRVGVKLATAGETVLDFSLKVGALAEKVIVTGEVPQVELATSALGALVDDRVIRDLPLNGRSFEQLALLQPGVVFYPHAAKELQVGAGTKFVVFGSRPHSNLFLLDGSDINDQADFTPGSAAGVVLGVETLREFRVQTSNYSAEYGRKSGGIINAVTKSGTNELRGSLFHFLRNDNFDARNFFDQEKPEFKRNQFGGTLGGPLLRNRTFIFGGYEGLREVLGLSNVAVVPNADMHRGCLPAAGRPGELRCVGVAPSVRPYLDLLPLPNGPDHGDGTGDYFSSPPRVTGEDNFSVRLDHQLGPRDALFVRYTFDDSRVTIPDKIPIFGVALKSRYQYATIEETHTFSPATLNTFRFSYNRSFSDSQATQSIGPTPELAFLPGQDLIGTINIEALVTTVFEGGFGTQGTLPRTFAYNLFEWSDDLSHVRGAHTLKFGFSFKRNQLNARALANNPRGLYGFRTLEDFLRARPFIFRAEAPGTDTQRGWRQSIFGFYGHDDFRPRHNLTFNLGLRYEFVTTPSEVHGKSSTLIRLTDPDVTTGPIWARNPSLKNFAPRVGLAWDPHGDGKSSVRTGFGMYYDLPVSYFYSIQGSRTFPFSFTGTVNNPPFPHAPANIILSPSARSLNIFNPDLATPAKMQYSATYQRELWDGSVLTAGFVGSDGYHLLRHQEANHFIPTILPDGRHFYPAGAQRVNPNFNTLRTSSTDVNSSYRALQINLERRLAGRLRYQVAYTLSKSTDTNSGAWGTDIRNQESFVEDPYDVSRDRALSGFDTRHILTINYTHDLPFGRRPGGGLAGLLVGGWQLNGITSLSSGQPFTVVLGGNRARTYPGNTRSRPNYNPDFTGDIVNGGPDQYFNPAAFVAPPPGFTGNVGRNSLIGPGLVNFDMALAKQFKIDEHRQLQFRVEAFNIFNRANFGTPLRVVFDSAGNPVGSAGQIKNTVTPSRQIQFGLKLAF